MAAPKFDIKLGTNLVQVFDGNPETLETFIASADLFEDFINAEFETATDPQKAAAQVTLVKFLKTSCLVTLEMQQAQKLQKMKS